MTTPFAAPHEPADGTKLSIHDVSSAVFAIRGKADQNARMGLSAPKPDFRPADRF
jgi:hypothetical protein